MPTRQPWPHLPEAAFYAHVGPPDGVCESVEQGQRVELALVVEGHDALEPSFALVTTRARRGTPGVDVAPLRSTRTRRAAQRCRSRRLDEHRLDRVDVRKLTRRARAREKHEGKGRSPRRGRAFAGTPGKGVIRERTTYRVAVVHDPRTRARPREPRDATTPTATTRRDVPAETGEIDGACKLASAPARVPMSTG